MLKRTVHPKKNQSLSTHVHNDGKSGEVFVVHEIFLELHIKTTLLLCANYISLVANVTVSHNLTFINTSHFLFLSVVFYVLTHTSVVSEDAG